MESIYISQLQLQKESLLLSRTNIQDDITFHQMKVINLMLQAEKINQQIDIAEEQLKIARHG